MVLMTPPPAARAPPPASRGEESSRHLKSVGEGIALVDENGVDAVLARPAGDRRHDGVVVADPRRGLDPTIEQRADDALMHELVADFQPSTRCELGHARRGAGAAR